MSSESKSTYFDVATKLEVYFLLLRAFSDWASSFGFNKNVYLDRTLEMLFYLLSLE